VPWKKSFEVDTAVERAMEVFWEKGYQGASISDLVAATGVKRQSLYNAVGDKQTLFVKALLKYDTEQRQAMLTSLEAQGTPVKSIQTLFNAVVEQSEADLNRRGCFLVNTALELQGHSDEVKHLVSAGLEDFRSFFEKLITHGKVRGEIPKHVDASEAASGLLAIFIGIRVMARGASQGSILLRQMANQAQVLMACA